MRLKLVFGVACASVLVFGTTAFSQQQLSPSCGSMQEAQGELVAHEKYFRNEEFAAFRKSALRRLSAHDTQEVVQDSAACQAVLAGALTVLRTYSSWPPVEERGYEFTVLRYGPYYAILMKPSDDPAAGPPPFDLLLIFYANRLRHILTILV